MSLQTFEPGRRGCLPASAVSLAFAGFWGAMAVLYRRAGKRAVGSRVAPRLRTAIPSRPLLRASHEAHAMPWGGGLLLVTPSPSGWAFGDWLGLAEGLFAFAVER